MIEVSQMESLVSSLEKNKHAWVLEEKKSRNIMTDNIQIHGENFGKHKSNYRL